MRSAIPPSSALLLLLVAACGGSEATVAAPPLPPAPSVAPAPTAKAAAPAATDSQSRQLDADTPSRSPSGATFIAPKGWFLSAKGDALVLEPPERDLSLVLVEVKEPDATKAIELAWKRVRPDFARAVKQMARPPARDGWDDVTQLVYESTPAEARTVIALARRKGDLEHVALIDAPNAALERRSAQLNQVVSSFEAAGVVEESFQGKVAHPLDAGRLKSFDDFVELARARSNVPGVAVAVIQGGKVVLAKGYGVRELGKKEPVTPKTLFMIGSMTKSLTTLMMAKLVDEGRFAWDTPVTDLLPSFALGDADATKKLRMKHTVCACTGLPRQDMELFFGYSKATPESRIAEMKSMKPTTAFGETFQYSNPMVSAGGYVAAHSAEPRKALGAAYDAAMKSRVFDALGMKSTTFDFAAAKRAEHASPHGHTLKLEYTALPLSAEARRRRAPQRDHLDPHHPQDAQDAWPAPGRARRVRSASWKLRGRSS